MFDTLLGTGGEDGSIVVVVQAPVMYIAIGDLNCLVQSSLRHLTYNIPMVQNSICLQPDYLAPTPIFQSENRSGDETNSGRGTRATPGRGRGSPLCRDRAVESIQRLDS